MAHLAMTVPRKVHPSQLELVPAQEDDCSARLAQQQPRLRALEATSKVIKKERGALGRPFGGQSLCSESVWLGAAV